MPAERAREKLLRAGGGERARERQHHHGVHAACRQGGKAVLVREQLLQPLGVEQLVRVDVERERDRAPARPPRSLLRAPQQVLVAAVDAVEHAERARGAVEHRAVEVGRVGPKH